MRTDVELVEAVLNGEKDAFAMLVKRYERGARAVALGVLGEHHLASDAAQDGFVIAFEKLSTLKNRKVFGAWLMKITRRCALDRAGYESRETLLKTAIAEKIEKPNGRLDYNSQNLLAAVEKLSESEKQLVTLRYFAGHSVTEVAGIVGRSLGTVTKQLSRSHKKLRRILERSQK